MTYDQFSPYAVKLPLFVSRSLYTPSIKWENVDCYQYHQIEMARNYVYLRTFGYDKFYSASNRYVENRVDIYIYIWIWDPLNTTPCILKAYTKDLYDYHSNIARDLRTDTFRV